MNHLVFPLSILDDYRCQMNIDLRLYAKEAINAAAYKYSALYYIHQNIDSKNPNIVNVVFESKQAETITEANIKEFCTELIDQQVRYDVQKEFGHIRNLIVEEAFKPVTKD